MSNNFGELLGNWLIPGIGTVFGGLANQAAYDEARAANEQRDIEGRTELDALRGRQDQQIREGFGNQLDFLTDSYGNIISDTGELGDQIAGGYADRASAISGNLADDLGGLQGGYDSRATDLGAAYGGRERDITSYFDTGAGELRGDFGERRSRILNLLQGLGTQARTDLDERFTNREADLEQDLQERGLGTSTVRAGTRALNERERNAEMRRLNDDLAREQAEYDTRLSGDELAAAQDLLGAGTSLRTGLTGESLAAGERTTGDSLNNMFRGTALQAGTDAGLTADALNAAERGGQNTLSQRLNATANIGNTMAQGYRDITSADQQNTGALANWIGARSDTYPNSNWLLDLANQFGDNSTGSPGQSNSNSWLGPAIGAAGTVGAAAVGGGALSGLGGASAAFLPFITGVACVALDSRIAVPSGSMPLNDVEVGDEVMNSEGEYIEVVATEHIYMPDGKENYIVECNGPSGKVILPREKAWPKGIPDEFFRKITIDNGTSIKLTRDHIIEGCVAGMLKIGDRIGGGRIVSIEKMEMMPCGDIMLKDGSNYVANGFSVSTMMQPKAVR